jgi:hypothetical protein
MAAVPSTITVGPVISVSMKNSSTVPLTERS